MGPKYILLKPKIYFSNNILLFGNFAATPLISPVGGKNIILEKD